MAIVIPEYKRQIEEQTPTVRSPQPAHAVPGAFGGMQAEAVERLGEIGSGIAEQMQRRAEEKYQLDQDQLETQLYMQSEDFKRDLLYNTETEDIVTPDGQKRQRVKGISNRLLSDSDGSTVEYRKKTEENNARILSQVKDANTYARLSKRLAIDTLNTQEQVIRHERTQWLENKKNIFDSGIKMAQENAANASTPEDLAIQIDNAAVAADKYNKVTSVDDTTAQLKLRTTVNDVIKNAIDGNLVKDKTGETSRNLLKSVEDKLTKEETGVLNNRIDEKVKENSVVLLDELNSKVIDGTLTLEDIQSANRPKEKGGIGSTASIRMLKDLSKSQAERIDTIKSDSRLAEKYIDVVESSMLSKVDEFKAKQILVDAMSDGLEPQEAKKIRRIQQLLEKQKYNQQDHPIARNIPIMKEWFGANENDKRELASALSNYLTEVDKGKNPDDARDDVLRNQYNKTYPQIPLDKDEKVIDPKREREIVYTPALEKIGKGFGMGVSGIVEGTGGALEAFGGNDFVKKIGKSISSYSKEMKDFYAVPDQDFLYQVSAGFGSTATFFLPGLGIAKGVNTMLAFPRLAAWVGASASAVMEAVVDSGSVYKQLIESGVPEKQANNVASKEFWAELPVTALTNKFGIFGESGGAILRAVRSFGNEGFQELSQGIIQNIAMNDPVLKDAMNNFVIGGIVGGGITLSVNTKQALGELGKSSALLDKLRSEKGSVINPFNEGQKDNIARDENGNPIEINPPTENPTSEGMAKGEIVQPGESQTAESNVSPEEKPLFTKNQELNPSKVKGIVREQTGQVKDQGGQVSEKKAFLQSLKDQVRAAAQATKATREEIFDVQNNLVNIINQSELEADDKAKFLKTIKNIQTQKELQKFLPDIEERINTLQEKETRRSLIADIRKQSKQAGKSNQISVDFAELIDDLTNEVDLKNRKPDTLARLQRSKDYFDNQLKQGNDVAIPKDVIKELDILSKKRLEDLSNADLESLSEKIGNLITQGETKLRLLESQKARTKQQDLDNLAKDSKSIQSKPNAKAPIGEKLEIVDNVKNKIKNGLNSIQEKGLSLSPMDVIFDILDGNKNYKGSNYKIFKERLDSAWSKYLNKNDSTVNSVIKLSNQLGMKESNFERIGVYAADQQEGGRQKLLDTGLTEEEIEAIKLNPDEMKLYNLMREKLDSLSPDIEEVMRVVYNKPFEKVKNYFSFMTDFDSMSASEIRDRFGDNVDEVGTQLRKNVEKGFTKSRTGGKQKIKLNAMEVFLRHVDNATYLTEVGPTIKQLGDLASTEEYGKSVGDVGQEIVRGWIDLLARKGNTQGDRIRILDTVRKNVGIATLGFKLSSVLVQPTSLFQGAALVGGSEVFGGATEIAKNKEARSFVLNNFPEIRKRVGDDQAFLEFGGHSVVDKTAKYGFWALQQLDMLAASSVALGAYTKAVEEKGKKVDYSNPDQEAIQEAQKMVRRTQASSFFKDSPAAISRGGLTGNVSFDKAILQFQSFMLNEWSIIQNDLYRNGFKSGNLAHGANVALWLILASLAENGSRRLSKELIALVTGEEIKEDDSTLLKDVALSLSSKIPFASQIVSAVNYGNQPVPSVEMGDKIIQRLHGAFAGKSMDTKTRNFVRGIVLLGSLGMGIPGGVQADQLLSKKTASTKKTRSAF